MKKLLLLLFATITTISCSDSKFEQIEYFKSPDRFRLFVYVAPTATIEEMKQHARSQMWTERKITEILYYRSNPFGSQTFGPISVSKNLQEAYKRAVVEGCVLRCQIDNFGPQHFSETPYEDHLKALEESQIGDEMLKRRVK